MTQDKMNEAFLNIFRTKGGFSMFLDVIEKANTNAKDEIKKINLTNKEFDMKRKEIEVFNEPSEKDVVLIVGPSGSGKTKLIKAISHKFSIPLIYGSSFTQGTLNRMLLSNEVVAIDEADREISSGKIKFGAGKYIVTISSDNKNSIHLINEKFGAERVKLVFLNESEEDYYLLSEFFKEEVFFK